MNTLVYMEVGGWDEGGKRGGLDEGRGGGGGGGGEFEQK